jgi:predicted signal transduction protein with EAL and GGDEF domain
MFAADTGARITAEGVERADEIHVLRDLGASFAQGYLLARPSPLDALFKTELELSHIALTGAKAPAYIRQRASNIQRARMIRESTKHF